MQKKYVLEFAVVFSLLFISGAQFASAHEQYLVTKDNAWTQCDPGHAVDGAIVSAYTTLNKNISSIRCRDAVGLNGDVTKKEVSSAGKNDDGLRSQWVTCDPGQLIIGVYKKVINTPDKDILAIACQNARRGGGGETVIGLGDGQKTPSNSDSAWSYCPQGKAAAGYFLVNYRNGVTDVSPSQIPNPPSLPRVTFNSSGGVSVYNALAFLPLPIPLLPDPISFFLLFKIFNSDNENYNMTERRLVCVDKPPEVARVVGLALLDNRWAGLRWTDAEIELSTGAKQRVDATSAKFEFQNLNAGSYTVKASGALESSACFIPEGYPVSFDPNCHASSTWVTGDTASLSNIPLGYYADVWFNFKKPSLAHPVLGPSAQSVAQGQNLTFAITGAAARKAITLAWTDADGNYKSDRVSGFGDTNDSGGGTFTFPTDTGWRPSDRYKLIAGVNGVSSNEVGFTITEAGGGNVSKTFSSGDSVQITDNGVNVRDNPAGNYKGGVNKNDKGTIVGTSVRKLLNGVTYDWWNVTFSNISGWVAENFLKKATTPSDRDGNGGGGGGGGTGGVQQMQTWQGFSVGDRFAVPYDLGGFHGLAVSVYGCPTYGLGDVPLTDGPCPPIGNQDSTSSYIPQGKILEMQYDTTGPVGVDAVHMWWRVDFDSGVDGWVIAGTTKVRFVKPEDIPQPEPEPALFEQGQCIKTRSSLETFVFSVPGGDTSNTYLGTQPPNSLGTITEGPITHPIVLAGLFGNPARNIGYNVYYKIDFIDNSLGHPDGWVIGQKEDTTGAINESRIFSSSECSNQERPSPDRAIVIGDRVEVTLGTNIRDADNSWAVLGVARAGTSGTVVDGPRTYTWRVTSGGQIRINRATMWKVDFNPPVGGISSGWVWENNVRFCTSCGGGGGGGGDTTEPTISITSPTSSDAYTTSATPLTIFGTASDNVGVILVAWANDRGGAGLATLSNTRWDASIALQIGENRITITATDLAGNQASDVLTVTYAPSVVGGKGSMQSCSYGDARADGNNIIFNAYDVKNTAAISFAVYFSGSEAKWYPVNTNGQSTVSAIVPMSDWQNDAQYGVNVWLWPSVAQTQNVICTTFLFKKTGSAIETVQVLNRPTDDPIPTIDNPYNCAGKGNTYTHATGGCWQGDYFGPNCSAIFSPVGSWPPGCPLINPTLIPSAIGVGTKVEVVTDSETNLNVRDSAGGTKIGSQSHGTQGCVAEGPTPSGARNWFRTDFSTGADGWVAGDFLKSIGTCTPNQTQTGAKFQVGDTVAVTEHKIYDTVNMRGPDACGPVLWEPLEDTQGTIDRSGPITCGGGAFNWARWHVNFGGGNSGWVVEWRLKKAVSDQQAVNYCVSPYVASGGWQDIPACPPDVATGFCTRNGPNGGATSYLKFSIPNDIPSSRFVIAGGDGGQTQVAKYNVTLYRGSTQIFTQSAGAGSSAGSIIIRWPSAGFTSTLPKGNYYLVIQNIGQSTNVFRLEVQVPGLISPAEPAECRSVSYCALPYIAPGGWISVTREPTGNNYGVESFGTTVGPRPGETKYYKIPIDRDLESLRVRFNELQEPFGASFKWRFWRGNTQVGSDEISGGTIINLTRGGRDVGANGDPNKGNYYLEIKNAGTSLNQFFLGWTSNPGITTPVELSECNGN